MTVRAWKPVVVLSLVGVGLVSVATAAPASTAPASAVVFPAGFGTPIYVGGTKVYSPPPATTTTIAATTTSTGVPTSTSTTSTTTAPTSTTTTTVPSTTSSTLPSTSPGCGLTQAAFCETFDAPAGNPATRTGDLNPTLWGVSRTNTAVNLGQGQWNVWAAATLNGSKISPPNDVRVINGQLVEAVNDNGGQSELAMYPKQPFDIDGRTGSVVFDTNADSQGPHAAWQEIWWTDQPVPSPGDQRSAQVPFARNSFGLAISGQCTGNVPYQQGGTGPYIGIDHMSMTANYAPTNVNFTNVGCVKKGTSTAMNHFEIRISQTRVEVWATDAGSTVLRQIANADVTMPMTRGVVWMQDVHYNACKFNTQCDHQFTWDNFGFDGPAPYRDLTFDVQDRTPTSLGWSLADTNITLTVPGVYWTQTPTAAYVLLNYFATDTNRPTVRVNGGTWSPSPNNGSTGYGWSTIAIPIPFTDLKVGVNTIEVQGGQPTVISNINIALIAAAPVP
jgi:hypothetical protein